LTGDQCPARRYSTGFTLIEVIGALVIFSVGVLMVIQLSGALSEQMTRAAISSEIVALAHERLDSLEALDFDSLTVGTVADTVVVQGRSYSRSVSVTKMTGLLIEIDVTLAPADSLSGPDYTATSYAASTW